MFETTRSLRRRRRPTTAIDLAPLMDMVFILLVFFLVTSTFSRDTGIDVDTPRAVTATSLPASSLRLVIVASGTIYLDGEAIRIAEVPSRVSRSLSSHGGSVVIVTDVNTPSGRLIEAMDAAKLGGATDIAVAADSVSGGSP